MKMKSKDMDLDILDELIGMCEDSMVSPFKKKKESIVVAEIEPKEEAKEAAQEDDLSEEDLEQLMGLYKKLKG